MKYLLKKIKILQYIKMAVKDTNKNVINIKIGDIDKKKKRKNKKKQLVQRPRQSGSYTFANTAPSFLSQPLHPQVPMKPHYNRVQEANLSTLVERENELKENKQREKALNSLIHSKLKESQQTPVKYEEPYHSFFNAKESPLFSETPQGRGLELENLMFGTFHNNNETTQVHEKNPVTTNTQNALYEISNTEEQTNPLYKTTELGEINNKKADIVLQKEPQPEPNDAPRIPIFNEIKKFNKPKVVEQKKISDYLNDESSTNETPMKNTPKIKTRRRGVLSVSDLRNDMKQQGLDISFMNEKGKTQLYSKKELLAIYKDVKKNREEKHKEEKTTKNNFYGHIKSPVPVQTK
jgi:hypothetical protein